MRTLIVYDSLTGNTRKIANAIFSALPGADKDICTTGEFPSLEDRKAVLYFVGFWIKKGSCSLEVIRLLSGLHGCRIALFGTCGFGSTRDDFDRAAQSVAVWIPEDSTCVGSFVCRGRMGMNVRRCCEKISRPGMEKILASFDEAMLHPDADDLKRAAEFARRMCAET